MKRLFTALAVMTAAAGCDALVGGACADGFAPMDGACVPLLGEAASDDDGAGGDGGDGGGPQNLGGFGVPPADTCSASETLCYGVCVDVQDHAMHCGACGHQCPSGICENGVCMGDVSGHVVALSMSYVDSTAAARKLLGNAVFLSLSNPVRILAYSAHAATDSTAAVEDILHEQAAIRNRLPQLHDTDEHEQIAAVVPGAYDVILIHDQVDAPRGWGASFVAETRESVAQFLVHGGALVVLATEESNEMPVVLNELGQLGIEDIVPIAGSQLLSADPIDVIGIGVPTPFAARYRTSAFVVTSTPSETLSFVFTDEVSPHHPVVIHRGVPVTN